MAARTLFPVLLVLIPLRGAESFVTVPAGTVRGHRLDEFEMASHPVTNAQYAEFVSETRHEPPLHWQQGRPPAGMENHPVVFVNRYDAAAYGAWRSRREGRRYRLPTVLEFEHAARAGNATARYPWGDAPAEGRANYDPAGNRTFAEWRTYLKPVASFAPNAWGLHDLAGNVWQFVDDVPDPATVRFKYRVEKPVELERLIAGGSWARSEYYLRCGVTAAASPGIRHPDLGFRMVREPAGSTHFGRVPRRVVAAPAGEGAVFVSWQLLPADGAGVGFHVYRAGRRDAAGERLTSEAVRNSTNFIDRNAPRTGRHYYRVRPVAGGKEGPPSEWAAVEPAASRSGLVMLIEPSVREGGFVPVFGDLDGDGILDVVLRLDNGIREMSRDPGVPVELEGFTHFGRSLWRRPLVRHENCFGSANNVPVVVHDLDGDGRAEVVARVEEDGKVWLAVLDGMTGRTLRRVAWTPMVSDFSKSSTRIHLAVAYLDGRTPSIVTQTGLYENEVFDAYDAGLGKLWQFRSLAETNGSGSHHIDIADVDGDGRDEVFNGTTVLNPDGTLRWSIYREHPDIVAIQRFFPDRPERQVFYAVESSVHAGAYLVDARTGRILWKVNREDDPRWIHAHTGWAADIWEGSPGVEMLTNRDGHLVQDLVLFGAGGKILANPFPQGWYPVNWTGGAVRDLMSTDGRRLGRFNGQSVQETGPGPAEHEKLSCRMVADLAGDYRDEVACSGRTAGGAAALFVYTNTTPVARREVTRTAHREYRLWMARNQGGGYASYFEWQP